MPKRSQQEDRTNKDPFTVPRGTITPSHKGDNRVTITRHVLLSNFTKTVGAEADAAYTFALSDVPGVADFSAAYDSYRFKSVEVTFHPVVTESLGAAGTNLISSPIVWSAIDFDSASASTIAALNEYGTCEVHSFLKPWTRKFLPRPASSVYSGSAFTNYARVPDDMWLDCANTGTPHYGLLVSAQGESYFAAYMIPIAKYTIEFARLK